MLTRCKRFSDLSRQGLRLLLSTVTNPRDLPEVDKFRSLHFRQIVWLTVVSCQLMHSIT